MLQTIRSHSGSWFIKCMLGAIIASFALWGITDIITGYGHNRPVANVGRHAITLEEFGHAYKGAIANMQRMYKAALTPEQMKEIGVPIQVLESLINKAIIDQEIKNMNLVVSDATVKQEVHAIPAFLNSSGTFDRGTFEQILRSQGMSENRFVNEVRTELQHHQMVEGFTGGLSLSDDYTRILFQALEQPIQFVAVDIPFKKMALPKSISDQDVETFYNGNKEQFRLPEYRTITLIRFDRDALKKQIVISDDVLKDEYERRKEEFGTPETRHIETLTAPTDALARKALDLFKAGKPLKTIARELNITVKDLGTLKKGDVSPAHAEDIFALDVGGMSKPFDSDKGWVLFSVNKIIPGSQKSYAEAKAAIEVALKDERFNEHFEALQNKVEDALAGGTKIQEVAHTYNLIIETFKAVDKFGQDEEGNKTLDETIQKDVLDYAFANSQGAESNMILAKESADAQGNSKLVGFIVRVDAIQTSTIPEFKSIKIKATEAYKMDLQNKAAAAMANDIVKNVKSVDDLKKQADTRKMALTNLPAVSRSNVDKSETLVKEMMAESIERMFALPEGETLLAQTKNGFRVVMFQGKLPYSFDNEKFSKFKDSMKQMLAADFQHSLRNYLRHSVYPVSINQGQMDVVVGHS